MLVGFARYFKAATEGACSVRSAGMKASVDLVSFEWHLMLGHTCSGGSSPHWGVIVVAEVIAQLTVPG